MLFIQGTFGIKQLARATTACRDVGEGSLNWGGTLPKKESVPKQVIDLYPFHLFSGPVSLLAELPWNLLTFTVCGNSHVQFQQKGIGRWNQQPLDIFLLMRTLDIEFEFLFESAQWSFPARFESSEYKIRITVKCSIIDIYWNKFNQ